MKQSRFILFVTGAFIALSSSATQTFSDPAYPSKFIKLVVPYAAGGGTDIIGRVVAEGLSTNFSQQVIVENRVGAGGSLGAAQVAKASPDGYTLLMGALTSHAINMSLQSDPGFDLNKSFAPVVLVGTMGLVLVVHPSLDVKSVAELIAMAKAEPGKLGYASAGSGSPQHLSGELFNAIAGTKLQHIPYRGAGPAMTDILGGHVKIMFDTIPGMLPHIKAGALRVLAVTTPERSEFLPDVPTMREQGLQGFSVGAKFGLLAPAGTPPDIVARVSEQTIRLLNSPKLIETTRAQGITLTPAGPNAMAGIIRDEIAMWDRTIKQADIKPE